MTNQLLAEALPGRGHNNPPLAEALDEELAPRRARADQLIELAGSSVIVDEESAAKVIDLVRMLKEGHWQCPKCRHLTSPIEEPDAMEPGETKLLCVLCAYPLNRALHFHAPDPVFAEGAGAQPPGETKL